MFLTDYILKGRTYSKSVLGIDVSDSPMYNSHHYRPRDCSAQDTRLFAYHWWAYGVTLLANQCFTRYWRSVHQRRKRIRNYVREMVLTFPRLMLCTLTFNDVLMTTSEDSRKQYVSRYLNSVCADYFACIDFGGKLGREHYHAIIAADYPMQFVGKHKRRDCYDFKDESKRWSNGWSNFTYIDTDGANVYKVLGYAMKSVNYAFKAADSGYKPFHKRCVYHCKTEKDWSVITDDAFL